LHIAFIHHFGGRTFQPDRYGYTLARPHDPDVPSLQVRIMRAIGVHTQRRTQLHQVLHPPGAVPATQDPPLEHAA
jgi:hypothetical protein